MPAEKHPSPPAPKFPKNTPVADAGKSPSELIDARIGELQDWRGELLARIRCVIRSADPEIVEEWKWNTPVWSRNGIVCTGETYKKAVKLTFPKGAYIDDPGQIFNASLEGNVRRAIDFPALDALDSNALTALVRAAIDANVKSAKSPSGKAKPKKSP